MYHAKPSVDLGYPTEPHGRIPAFASVEEEAAFRDTHDLADFSGDEIQTVLRPAGGDLAQRLTLRLDRTDRAALTRLAKAQEVGPSTLARMWLKERLRRELDAASG